MKKILLFVFVTACSVNLYSFRVTVQPKNQQVPVSFNNQNLPGEIPVNISFASAVEALRDEDWDTLTYYLYSHGIDDYNPSQLTLLLRAITEQYVSGVEWLLQHGANPNLPGSKNLQTYPIIVALQKANREIAQLLLQYNANPTVQNIYGATPMWWAVYYGDINLVQLLLKYNISAQVLDLVFDNKNYNPESLSCLDYARSNALRYPENKGMRDIVTALEELSNSRFV